MLTSCIVEQNIFCNQAFRKFSLLLRVGAAVLQQGSSQGCPDYICQICGDDIDILQEENEYFIACNECAFPVCRTCYEYERQEGTQVCPRCKTRYKRHKGMPFAP